MHRAIPEPGLRLEEICRAVADGLAQLRQRGVRRRYPLGSHLVIRLLSSAMLLVYLAAMGFVEVPRLGRLRRTLREWWLLLWCAWAAGPLLLAELGAIDVAGPTGLAGPVWPVAGDHQAVLPGAGPSALARVLEPARPGGGLGST